MDTTLVFSGDQPASTLSNRVSRGELVRLAAGVYTTETRRAPADVVAEHMFEIVGRLLPGAVITDRSARTGAAVDHVLYLARDGRARDLDLPGLTVRARRGAGPQPGDVAYPGGLYLASRARGLAENSRPSRSRAGPRRTLDEAELGDWVDYICQNDGPDRLLAYRQQAQELAPTLGVAPARLARLQSLIGIALGTRPDDPTSSGSLTARRAGRPVDQSRVRRFETLVTALRRAAPQSRPRDPASTRSTYLPFFEAYFSNFIEGTEFEVDEAARIVFDHEIPPNRPADAHDITGTHRLVADPDEMRLTGADAAEFIALLRRRNATILEGRPHMRPGAFKQAANRAGATWFVSPDLVEGTLTAGFGLRDQLDTAWEKAVYIAFVVAEVHPFDDGNGRTARVMMNAELHAAGQGRIIVPTVFRQDYLDG
ncbi:MAG: Fic family protein, partial [Thermocrispum sp.]